MSEPRAIVFVEGISDRSALEALARRRGHDLAADGVAVVPIGGAQALGRHLARAGGSRVAGLVDAGEEREFRRALERAGFGEVLGRADLERLGFFVCDVDLEDELVRALGPAALEQVFAAHGILRSFRTYQKQVEHRARPLERQLHGFLHNWKVELAAALVDALDLDRVPPPLDRVLAHVTRPV